MVVGICGPGGGYNGDCYRPWLLSINGVKSFWQARGQVGALNH